jgi:hypothetical protein
VPRVVPSQVVSAIDGLFGSSRNELDAGVIHFIHRDNVRTLLSLLDQMSDELITVPFVDYTDYLKCRSALTSALSIWDAHHQGPAAKNVGGRDPVERIRCVLMLCPDDNPPPYPELTFIPDAFARASVQEDIRAAWIDFRASEWKGATVFAATAVEALLFWALKGRSDLQQPDRLDKMHLVEYVAEARRLSVVGDTAASQANLAIDGRNLIHAGKVARTGLVCSKTTALIALAALEAVMGDLRTPG